MLIFYDLPDFVDVLGLHHNFQLLQINFTVVVFGDSLDIDFLIEATYGLTFIHFYDLVCPNLHSYEI
jgi:hypothetical protein